MCVWVLCVVVVAGVVAAAVVAAAEDFIESQPTSVGRDTIGNSLCVAD